MEEISIPYGNIISQYCVWVSENYKLKRTERYLNKLKFYYLFTPIHV